jgi:Flp pilus assembly protein TadG
VSSRPIFRSSSPHARPKPGWPFTASSSIFADLSGIAAFEFAAVAPVLIITFGGVSDIGIAVWDHMTTAAAVNAGADYAVATAQINPPTSTNLTTYLANVAGVISGASRGGATLRTSNIVVEWNNVTSNANFGLCYCVPATGVFPSATTSCGGSCPDGTTAGEFVQIQATYNYTALSPLDTPFLSGSYTDTALVRVQ